VVFGCDVVPTYGVGLRIHLLGDSCYETKVLREKCDTFLTSEYVRTRQWRSVKLKYQKVEILEKIAEDVLGLLSAIIEGSNEVNEMKTRIKFSILESKIHFYDFAYHN